jgi:predicted ATPase
VRLFLDRAGAALPGLAATERNARAIAAICERLAGIPLAIELAAAWVRALAPEQIAARLDDRFRLLTGSSRTAPPRQQTLLAAIAWSYATLTDVERLPSIASRSSPVAGSSRRPRPCAQVRPSRRARCWACRRG